MASACVNNMTVSPDKFLDGPAAFPWRTPRKSKSAARASPPPPPPPEQTDPELTFDFEFEFRPVNDPVNVLAADELFSDGKLVPLHLRRSPRPTAPPQTRSPENIKIRQKIEILNTDPYLFSPKAPRCSSRWKDLLGLKKLNINNNPKNVTNSNNNSKSLKMFLHRSSKATGSNLDSPLLPESEFITSARFSLSSSSSGSCHEHDLDLPRHSLDSNNINKKPKLRLPRQRAFSSENPIPTRMGRTNIKKSFDSNNGTNNGTIRGLSVDSPRMNASGRVIFQGLERSSSSPSSFNGGPRLKYKGMERSYSANVRVTPVLNVPVCSLMGSSRSSVFGFQMFNNGQKSAGSRGHLSKIRTEKP